MPKGIYKRAKRGPGRPKASKNKTKKKAAARKPLKRGKRAASGGTYDVWLARLHADLAGIILAIREGHREHQLTLPKEAVPAAEEVSGAPSLS